MQRFVNSVKIQYMKHLNLLRHI